MTFLNRHRSRIRPVGPFAPSSLFFGGIPGAWYDPTDLSTMFQDSTGTTPVTAVEQPVGLILDKSQGLALGPELVTNGDFSGGTTGWSVSAGGSIAVVGGKLQVTSAGGGVYYVTQSFATTVGKTYRMQGAIAKLAPVFTSIRKSDNATASLNVVNLIAALGSASGVFVATSATTFIVLQANGLGPGDSAEFDDISIRELAGNHASQSTAASRPTYRARYNMVEQSEAFNNAWWTKIDTTISSDAGVAPDGTTTADLMYPTTSGSDRFVWRTPAIVGINGQSYTVSVYAKASGKSFLWFATLGGNTSSAQIAFFNLQTGQVTQVGAYFDAVTIQSVGSGWYRCTATKNVVASANLYPIFGVSNASGSSAVTTNGTDGVLLWGAQLLTAADVTATGNAYQRIAAATVYDTAPVFRPYLAFDGVDDSLSTAAINFTSTDKMSVFSGLAKNTDATTYQLVAELSASVNTNNGAFALWAPGQVVAGGGFEVSLRGTSLAGYAPSGYAAPINVTLTALLDIGAATLATEIVPRVNGTVVQTTPFGVAGTGNFGTYPLFIGRRGGTTLPFNGRLYSLIVRGAASSTTEIIDTETWVNARTGGY